MADGQELFACCRRFVAGELGSCPPPPSPRDGLRIFCGATLGMAALAYLAMEAAAPVLVASFGASACLIFAAPRGPFSRPRNVVLGHVIAAATGVAVANTLGCTWYGAALAVGGAIAAMLYSGTLHPPAAATALIAVLTNQGLLYPFVPVGAGAALLMATGTAFNRIAGAGSPQPGHAEPKGDEERVHKPSAGSRA